jgi:hypothetical protein
MAVMMVLSFAPFLRSCHHEMDREMFVYSAISLTCGFDTSTAARVDTVTAAPIDIVSMSFW